MDSNKCREGSCEGLVALAQQLRLYKPIQHQQQQQQQQQHGNQIPETKTNSNTQEFNSLTESKTTSQRSNRAAVLICIFQGNNGELRVILTKRSSTLSSHSGEVALPGGKRDEADVDDVETALREAKEEIGLDPSLVDVVTVLESFVNKRGITVVPVIGILTDKKAFSPAPNAAEVEAIFDAPLDMFLKDENRRDEEREWMGDKYLLHFFDYEAENKKYVIWALTAGILIRVASIIYQQPPVFSERRPKFWSRVVDKEIPRM